jgi:DNA-binding MarR family transcriptional regulator
MMSMWNELSKDERSFLIRLEKAGGMDNIPVTPSGRRTMRPSKVRKLLDHGLIERVPRQDDYTRCGWRLIRDGRRLIGEHIEELEERNADLEKRIAELEKRLEEQSGTTHSGSPRLLSAPEHGPRLLDQHERLNGHRQRFEEHELRSS